MICLIRIAIVDDEKMFVSYFQKELKKLFQQNDVNCIITSYTSGQSFLEKYQKNEYDLIFLDIDIGINTETGNAFFEPPVDHLIDFFADDWVLPV